LKKLLDAHLVVIRHGRRIKDVEKVLRLANKAEEIGISNLGKDEFDSIRGFLRKLKENGWNPIEFIDYSTAHYKHINSFRRYIEGKMSLDEYIDEVMEVMK
jgi:hypothetical protein